MLQYAQIIKKKRRKETKLNLTKLNLKINMEKFKKTKEKR